MILLNVFFKAALMIIGYISGIALSYVGVWILNTGFMHVMDSVQGLAASAPIRHFLDPIISGL